MSVKKKVSVSELKTHALQIIEGVKTNKKEVEIYKRGVLVAKIVPVSEKSMKDWIGSQEGNVTFHGERDSILEPIDIKWEANE